ncbi:spermatogenesis-associated protein 31D3-like [Hipposideros larvatus]
MAIERDITPSCSITEPCLCFLSTSLNVNPDLAGVCVLWLLLLFLCYLVGIPSLPTAWETKNRQKHQGRAKRRRKGGTRKGCRYHQREEEEKKRLISILKSPLGQHYDTMRFRQMLCPDHSCEVCNHATAEIHSLLFPEAMEDATPSVSPLASTVSGTGSSSHLSPTFSNANSRRNIRNPNPLAPHHVAL